MMRDPVPSPNKLPNRGLSCFAESLKDAPVLSESEIRRILSELMIDPSDCFGSPASGIYRLMANEV